LKIAIRPDARFERRDDDIYTDFEIPYTVAALGGEAKVDTPEGSKPLDIPAGTQTGQAFRMTGHGMPKIKGGKGNLIARAKIVVPKHLSPRERDLLKEIASLRNDGVTINT
jgi:DnaJ-class molecular chaperone